MKASEFIDAYSVRHTGTLYLDDFLISASRSFDTYCSTVAAELADIDFDVFIAEITRRRARTQEENMLKLYDMGIEIFIKYKKSKVISDVLGQKLTTPELNLFNKILK